MKSIAAVLVLLCLGTSTLAQQTAQQQQTPVKMECRDLSATGNVLPNESLVNGMACHVVPPAKTAPMTPAPTQAPVSTQAYAPVSANASAAPISTRIISGSTV